LNKLQIPNEKLGQFRLQRRIRLCFLTSLKAQAFGSSVTREDLRGKYHCTVDLLFDWIRNVHLCCVHWISYCTDAHF